MNRVNKNDFPEELKKTISSMGFDFETLSLIDEEKKNGVYYFLDEFDIWFPDNKEYKDFILITIEVHHKRKDNSFSIVLIHGHATRYFRKKNFTKYHSELTLLFEQGEINTKQKMVEQLRSKMFTKHVRTETKRLNQLIQSSRNLYPENS